MEGLTKCSLSVSPLWPAGECGTALGTCRQGGRFPVPGSGGGGGGPVCSAPMRMPQWLPRPWLRLYFIHLIISVGSVKR